MAHEDDPHLKRLRERLLRREAPAVRRDHTAGLDTHRRPLLHASTIRRARRGLA
jgi:hypothetical protein